MIRVSLLFFFTMMLSSIQMVLAQQAVDDEATFDIGDSLVEGNLLDNDIDAAEEVVQNPKTVSPESTDNFTFYYFPGFLVGYFENNTEYGKLNLGLDGEYNFHPPSTPLPNGHNAVIYEYTLSNSQGGEPTTATLTLWVDTFEIVDLEEIADPDFSADLMGFADNAHQSPDFNPPDARTAQMTVADAMNPGFPMQRVSPVRDDEEAPDSGSGIGSGGIKFLAAEFDSADDIAELDGSHPWYIEGVASGTLKATFLYALKDGLYQYDASLGMVPKLFDGIEGKEESPVFLITFGVGFVHSSNGHFDSAGGMFRAYEMDPEETAGNITYMEDHGVVRLSAGDFLYLTAHHDRHNEDASEVITPMYIEKKPANATESSSLTLRWISP